ncbi:hypothetical protein Cflav_PD0623 [Pedosphaera parvula Ellin514]|uniref:Uncharacterized protein n=1 Tax=Pedosphaera parvula (strain Ellin514) TaxID=320771 RepID=B9XQW4_PEDPL|nr:hypothetical protein Cflav_PD0623 [Pedosphaera parvula Ellin514]
MLRECREEFLYREEELDRRVQIKRADVKSALVRKRLPVYLTLFAMSSIKARAVASVT